MRILVVEKEKKVARFIKKGLVDEGYQVDVAFDAEKGVKIAGDFSYSLIVIDMLLPKKNVIAAIKEIRENYISTPILCLTARNAIDDSARELDCGADDYLEKPFAFAELVARIRSLVRRGAKDRGADLLYADLLIDPVGHQVWRGGEELDLTAKEYALLEYFMRNQEKTLTRRMIAEHVWDYTFDSFTNIIDVYVNYLRKKIDRNYNVKLIHPVRHTGYVLHVNGAAQES